MKLYITLKSTNGLHFLEFERHNPQKLCVLGSVSRTESYKNGTYLCLCIDKLASFVR